MILFKKATDLTDYLDSIKESGKTTGFVPTMGALHKGHLSLIQTSTEQNDVTICSIFVNPTQFNDLRDFEKYPVTIEKDIYLLETSGCDILFLPSVHEIYPDGFNKAIRYDLGTLETILEGQYRPGHFQGVCLVVHRLLEIVRPGRLYLGQKDYQQCLVIIELLGLIGIKDLVKPVICPTLREPDGLAMSSRNMRLNEAERSKAPLIFKTLNLVKDGLPTENIVNLKAKARELLEENGFKVDYVEIAMANDLQAVKEWNHEQKLVILIAAFINEIRLIDNFMVN